MNKRAAQEIRRGIVLARQVIAGERLGPKLTLFAIRGTASLPLWESAYHHELTAAVRDGRIRPPRGHSGVSA